MKTNDKKLYEQIIYTTQGLSSKNTCKQPQSITTGDDISKTKSYCCYKRKSGITGAWETTFKGELAL
jgi:hypothetical protein